MEHHIKAAETITFLLENRFTFLKYKFGLDPLLGLIPWLGDFVGLLFSLYLIWIAGQMKLPEEKIREMIRNIIADFLIGVVPFVGSVGDFFFKANSRNLKILKEHVHIREAVVVSSA